MEFLPFLPLPPGKTCRFNVYVWNIFKQAGVNFPPRFLRSRESKLYHCEVVGRGHGSELKHCSMSFRCLFYGLFMSKYYHLEG